MQSGLLVDNLGIAIAFELGLRNFAMRLSNVPLTHHKQEEIREMGMCLRFCSALYESAKKRIRPRINWEVTPQSALCPARATTLNSPRGGLIDAHLCPSSPY